MNKWEKDKENGGLSGGKDYYNPCLREGLSGRITKIIYNICLEWNDCERLFIIWEKIMPEGLKPKLYFFYLYINPNMRKNAKLFFSCE